MMTNKYLIFSYLDESRKIYFSILFVIPMLFIYEIMCWFQFIGSEFQIRNGADVFIRQFFLSFGHNAELVYSLFLFIIFIMIMFSNREVINAGTLKVSLLLFMLLESCIWTALFIIFMGISESAILSIMQKNILPQQFYLSIGAGIWEEFLFRVGAMGFIIYLLTHILGYNRLFSILIAIIISSLIFSMFHYIGELGDIFTFKSFYLRLFAGIFLGTLYISRGFGITAYTHIFYDMTIISMPILIGKN